MKNRWKFWLLSVMAVFVLAACNGNEATEKTEGNEQTEAQEGAKETSYPVTLVDAADNEITLDQAPERIVSMLPSNTEILVELGLIDEVVGISDFDDYPEEVTAKEKIGGQEFNVEAIIGLNPDIVFGHESAFGLSEEGYQQIANAGIPVFVVKNAKDFDETYTTIQEIAQLTNTQKKGEEIISSMKAQVEEVLAKVKDQEPRRIFIETTPAPEIYTPGNNTFMQEIVDMLGAKNIADDQEGWFIMDPEEILNRNPEVIIVMYDFVPTAVEDVYQRDGFDTIKAIQEKQVSQVDENLTSRTGPRLAQGLEEVAKAIYPEAFGE